MRPKPSKSGADASMDAVFFSPHKFIGGPGSSGLLVARRSIFTNTIPTCPGKQHLGFIESNDCFVVMTIRCFIHPAVELQ